MRAVVFDLSIPRYVAAKAMGRAIPALFDGAPSCLAIRDDVAVPALPGPQWVELAPLATGVCGTDLATVYFKSAPSLSPFGSFPFVPGHEIVARVSKVGRDVTNVREGDRVIVDPWLRCELRGVAPACARCEAGEYATCERAGVGPMRGMMLGAVAELPGGFAERLVAHASQLFVVAENVTMERAALAEPMAVASHAVLRHPPRSGERVLVIGGGAIAYCVMAALRAFARDADVTALVAESAQVELARRFRADRAWRLGEAPLVEQAAALTRAAILKPVLGPRFLAGGFDVVYDCVGSAASLRDAFAIARSGGTIVMVGAAGVLPHLDLTHLWTKELALVGTLAYDHDTWRSERRRTFDIVNEHLASFEAPLDALVTHRYGLGAFREALRANLDRGRTGAFKTLITPNGALA